MESKFIWVKFLCLVAALLMLTAILSTYSTGAWVGIFAGFLVFIVLVGRFNRSIHLLLIAFSLIVTIILLFPSQIGLQIAHSSDALDLATRFAAWRTATNIIQTFPWTGIGLGTPAYLARSGPYLDPQQYILLSHPHNAYLEIGAMAGLPVLAIFISLLLLALYRTLRNWSLIDQGTRALYAGGLASIIALSINSFSINGWTLAPLAAAAWLIFGAISSPLPVKKQILKLISEKVTSYKQFH